MGSDWREAEQDARGGDLEANVLEQDLEDRRAGVERDRQGDQGVVDDEVGHAGGEHRWDVVGADVAVEPEERVAADEAEGTACCGRREDVLPGVEDEYPPRLAVPQV